MGNKQDKDKYATKRTVYETLCLDADWRFEQQVTARYPIGRLCISEEVAEAVVWLCSDAASFVTRHTMTVDGGYVA